MLTRRLGEEDDARRAMDASSTSNMEPTPKTNRPKTRTFESGRGESNSRSQLGKLMFCR